MSKNEIEMVMKDTKIVRPICMNVAAFHIHLLSKH